MNRIFLWTLILFLFWGCKQPSIELPSDSVPRIVLYGFISPQRAQLNISQSAPAGQDLSLDNVFLNEAIPILQKPNGEVLDTLVRVDSLGNYKFSKHVNIEATKTYVVKVLCDGFEPVTTTIEIPKSMPSEIVATAIERSSYTWGITLEFDYYLDTYYLFQVDGFDGTGVHRFIDGQNNPSNEYTPCPSSWVQPLFFAHSSCLQNSNPTISMKIYKKTRDWDTGDFIDLKKVQYRISVVDEKYRNIFQGIGDLLVGYTEPILTEGFVQGGYGFIVPYNAKLVDIYL